MPETFAV